MKKILVLIALILCFSMVLTSCDFSGLFGGNNNDVDDSTEDEKNEERVDNVEANIEMLVKLFNTYENADQIYEEVKGLTEKEIDLDLTKITNDLKKYEAQGSTFLSAWEDGEKLEEDVDLSFALKNNAFQLSGLVDGSEGGLHAYIGDDLKAVFAVWENEDGIIDVNEAVALDINAVMDQYMGMMEEYVGQMSDVEIPLDLKEIVLGGIKTADIEYKDGKYVLSTDAIYNSIVATIDSFLDSAADEGLVTDDIIDQVDEIKDMAKDVLDAIDIEIYFLVKYEAIEGLGMSIDVKTADVLEAMGMDADAADANSVVGSVEYIKAAFEASINGEFAHVEFKHNGNVNVLNADIEFVTEGDKLIGMNTKYEMNVNIVSEYEREAHVDHYTGEVYQEAASCKDETVIKANMVYNTGIIYDGDNVCGMTVEYDMDMSSFNREFENTIITYESTDKAAFEASATLNLANFEKANSTVVDMSFDMSTESAYAREDDSRESKDNVTFTASVKTTEANKADIVIEVSNAYSSKYSDGENHSGEDTIKVAGTIEFTTKNVTVPSVPADVKDAMDEAAANPMDPEDLFGNKEETEEYPEFKPEYDYDYNEPDYDEDYGYDYDEDYGF